MRARPQDGSGQRTSAAKTASVVRIESKLNGGYRWLSTVAGLRPAAETLTVAVRPAISRTFGRLIVKMTAHGTRCASRNQ